ncbi:MAG TPA: glycosyltransferase [Acidimicrobiales bacterium]|nr:glycosyltransferase [Acidimicrobiales bacterium]
MTSVLLDARLAARGLGISTFVERLLAAMDANGVVTHVWKGSGEWGRPAKLAALSRSGLFDVSPRADPRARGFDVVHFASNVGSLFPGSNSVVTVHDLLHRRARGARRRDRLTGALLERSVLRAGRVVSVSDRTRAELERALPSLSGRVEVIPHGMRRLARPGRDRQHILAFGGAADPRKRTDLMVAVYREYRASTAGALPLVVLARAGLTTPQREALIAQGARIVPGATRDEVDALMAGAAALLYTTTEEGFGLPILEAAEVGTPVVMDAAAAVAREVVGDHCFPVSGAAVTAWVDQLRRAAASAPVAGALDLPDWAEVAARYQALYEQVRRR